MTKVISHRGANKLAPQNTIPAFQKAIELKADGFENDVHVTKDGFIVVCHDQTIDNTSNGTGRICDMTLAELRKFDFGSYFSDDFIGTKIPTLEEFLDLCKYVEIVNIEIKAQAVPNTDICRKVINMVKEFNLFEKLIISSFEHEILLECKEVDKNTKVGYLYSPVEITDELIFEDLKDFRSKYNFDALHPFMGVVSEDYINECHEAGFIVNPWTVNRDHALECLKAWNCDGAITDNPELAANILRA